MLCFGGLEKVHFCFVLLVFDFFVWKLSFICFVFALKEVIFLIGGGGNTVS